MQCCVSVTDPDVWSPPFKHNIWQSIWLMNVKCHSTWPYSAKSTKTTISWRTRSKNSLWVLRPSLVTLSTLSQPVYLSSKQGEAFPWRYHGCPLSNGHSCCVSAQDEESCRARYIVSSLFGQVWLELAEQPNRFRIWSVQGRGRHGPPCN